eukprot:COSAG01_NODE_5357_length_4313_cov_1.870195_2_plen_108_part_00
MRARVCAQFGDDCDGGWYVDAYGGGSSTECIIRTSLEEQSAFQGHAIPADTYRVVWEVLVGDDGSISASTSRDGDEFRGELMMEEGVPPREFVCEPGVSILESVHID